MSFPYAIPCSRAELDRPEPVVSLHHVSTRLPNGTPLLQDINLEVYPGDFLLIKGESGSGKSTIHRTIAGLETPVAGEVRLFGENIQDLSKSDKTELFSKRIGLGFQNPNLYGGWSVLRNLVYYAEINGQKDTETYTRASAVLHKFGLAGRIEQDASTLSGGQQQLVALGSLLITKPELLLTDEPTASMDGPLKERTFDTLRGLADSGMAILMVSHDEQASAYATRTVEVGNGRILRSSVHVTRSSAS